MSSDAVQDPLPVWVAGSDISLNKVFVPASVIEFLANQPAAVRTSGRGRLFGRNPVPRQLRSQYRAAQGDIGIIDVLSQLGSDWLVRAVGVPGQANVEYLLVGRAGTYCLSVRHQLGSAIWIDGGVMLSDGERLSHLRDAEFSAVRLTQVVSDAVGYRVEVSPCLVLTGCRSLTVARPPRRVAVMTSRELRAWLKGLPSEFSVVEAEQLRSRIMTHPGNTDAGHSALPNAEALVDFRKVQTEMSQARHVRLTWVTGALVFLWLAAVVGIGGVATSFLAH